MIDVVLQGVNLDVFYQRLIKDLWNVAESTLLLHFVKVSIGIFSELSKVVFELYYRVPDAGWLGQGPENSFSCQVVLEYGSLKNA